MTGDKLEETIATYNHSAKAMTEYFRSIPARSKDINRALGMLDESITSPRIVEIGCGDGRDAKIILQKTQNYIGFDPAEAFINMAKINVPGGNFIVGDARTFDYPKKLDVVFAFASMLHLDRKEFADVLDKVHKSLNVDGIFYISLKKGDKYQSYIKKDKYGSRLFYFYTPELVQKMTADKFDLKLFESDFTTENNTRWFEIALRKK